MYTVAELIADLLRLDQKGPVFFGCLWTREDCREFIEGVADMTEDETNKITDDSIDELLMKVDEATESISNENVEDALWGLILKLQEELS